MDTPLYGYHPAAPLASAGAGGAAPPSTNGGSGRTPPPSPLDEAPAFELLATQTRLYLTGTGRGGPDSVADGTAAGETGHLSDEALAGLGAELLPPADLENRNICLTSAYIRRTAEALGLHHSPLPRDAEVRLEWMTKAGLTDPQSKLPPTVTSLDTDLAMETAPAGASALAVKVSAARAAFQAVPSDTAATLPSDLEALFAKTMLASGATTPPPSQRTGAASTLEPRASLPPTPPQQTPKNLADGAVLRRLKQQGARKIYPLPADVPSHHGACVLEQPAGERGHDGPRHARQCPCVHGHAGRGARHGRAGHRVGRKRGLRGGRRRHHRERRGRDLRRPPQRRACGAQVASVGSILRGRLPRGSRDGAREVIPRAPGEPGGKRPPPGDKGTRLPWPRG